MIILSVVHAIFCLITISFAALNIYKKRTSILSFIVLGFVILDSISISYIPYLNLSAIQYLDNPSFLINDQSVERYSSQIYSHWVFLAVATVFMASEYLNVRSSTHGSDIKFLNAISLMIGALALIFLARYFLFGPGLTILLSSQIAFSSTTEAITSRSALRLQVENGQGGYMATIAAKVLLPYFAATQLHLKSRFCKPYWFISLFLSLAYAFQTREKAPLVIALVLYIGIYFWSTVIKRGLEGLNMKMYLKVGLLSVSSFYIIGALTYVVNFGLSPQVAFESIFARTLAIPGATEANFFDVFPRYYDFRGLGKIFSIPLGGFNGLDISIYEIAYAATGNVFASNSSFIAVAWSGGGYLGVLAISIILCTLILLVDIKLAGLSYEIYILCIILTLPGLVGLTSGSLLDFTTWGGIILPIMVIYSLRRPHSQSPQPGNYTKVDYQ